MKIRSKLLVLLLLIALLPILALVMVTRISIRQLSTRISRDIQTRQFQDTVEGVTVHVHNYREAILGSHQSLQLALQVQAREVEQQLAAQVSHLPAIPDNWQFGFNEELSIPTGRWMQRHPFVDEVNFRFQRFFLTAGTKPKAIQLDLARLRPMTGVYHDLYEANRGRTLWHYTSLESGLHTSYPARKQFALPEDYDARKRNWYQLAKESDRQAISISISIDATTKKLVLTASMPVYHLDGTFAGVTAIDKGMDDIVSGLKIPTALRGRAGLFLVALGRLEAPMVDELIVLYNDQYSTDHLDWQEVVDLPSLSSTDQAIYAQLLDDLRSGVSGDRTMEYDGKKAVWIYSRRIGRKAALLMIVPFDVIDELARQTQAVLLDENLRQLRLALVFVLCIIISVMVLSFWGARKFVTPIDRLAGAANSLATGDYSARANVQTGDELQQLAEVFNDLGPKLMEHEKTQRSLALARAIQQNLLPQRAPRLPGFEIAGRCRYCDETGGDYFDFIHLPDPANQKLGVVLGDVTGHGVGAALLMASARSILRNASLNFTGDLAELMSRFNDQLSEDTGDDKFMTLFYGALDGQSRSLTWASGGHDPALWYHREKDDFEELPNTGPLAGYMKNMAYEQAGPVTLDPGDILLIGTDGIWEAEDPSGELYGKDRLYEMIRSHANNSAGQIVDAVIEAVEAFSYPAPPLDDITLIVIRAC
jgi:sigma-B regulation protein RsbU (phosphoserine phosphatase)